MGSFILQGIMMKSDIQVEIASPPDRERLVAQIVIGNEQWCEVSQESGKLELQVYHHQDGTPWVIDFDAAISALVEARQRLVGDN
jgi:hypothetical protein